MDVAHGRMARIPCFGKDAKVRELQLFCDLAGGREQFPCPRLNRPSVQHEQGKGQDIDDRQDEEDGGFSYVEGL